MSMEFNIGTRPSVVPPPPVRGAGESAVSDPAALLAGAGVTLSAASGMPGDIAPASGVPGGVEDVGTAVEAALTRDDALGQLMDAAFNLPPPVLPKFEE